MTSPRRVHALLALIATQTCLHASMAGLRMALPLYALRMGRSEAAVGPLLALFSVAPIALALPAGRLADRRGYHLPVQWAVALTVAGALLAWLATWVPAASYPLLCLAALLSGAGGNIGMIAVQRTAGRHAHDATELKRVFSYLGVAPSVSNAVGPLAAGVLIDSAGFASALALLSALPLLSLYCATFVAREAPTPRAERPLPSSSWELLGTPLLRRLLLVNWFMSASWDVHSFLVPVLGHERGLSASAIGAVLGTFAISVTAVRLVIPLLAHRLRGDHVLTYAMAVVALSFAIYPSAVSAWSMAACASLLGFALGCSQPMVMTTLHQITPAKRHGEAIALRSLAMNCSSAVLPLGFGTLGVALGAAGLFWSMSGLVALGALVARSLGPAGSAGAAPLT